MNGGGDRWEAVDAYISDRLIGADPALDAALVANGHAGLPAIDVSPPQGKLLHLLARLAGARRILEVGTLGGYSTIWLARALPADGRLVSLEIDPHHAEVARANVARAGLVDRVDIRVGPATETLDAMPEEAPFDLIFIDADKPNNPTYFAAAMRLSRPGTLILCDNVVRAGRVIDAASADPAVRGTRALFDAMAAEPRIDATAIQTVGGKGWDGFAIAIVRGGRVSEENILLDPGFADRFEAEARPVCQLYLVSPLEVGGGFPDRLARALDAGPIAAFQFRVKGLDQHAAAALAEPLLAVCRARDVAFLVNDSVALAKRLGADGVHLGQEDGDPREARSVLGREAQIGVTCHDSRHLAMDAGEAGADYVAFGAFYPTTTKEVRHRPEPSILSWWATITGIPSVAIGGITAANAAPLVAAGADFLAVSSAIWNDPEGEAAAVRRFAEVLHGGG